MVEDSEMTEGEIKAKVEEEARLGCEYGTYCDGEDRVFYPGGVKGVSG